MFMLLSDILMATTLHYFYTPEEQKEEEKPVPQQTPVDNSQSLLVKGNDGQMYYAIRV